MEIGNVSESTKRAIVFFLSAIGLIRMAGFATSYLVDKQSYTVVVDDPLITLRVAYNIAHGFGPYYNHGEHVAANTSLFWPFVLAPVFHFLSLPQAVLFLSIFTVMLTVLVFALIAWGASSLRCAVFSLATFLLLPSFIQYAPTIWEHIPQTVLTTAALLVLLGRPKRFQNHSTLVSLVLLDLAFFLRPDTLPLMGAVGLAVLFGLRRKFTVWSLVVLAFTAFTVLGYFSLHHFFYGDIFPNTYYLKVAFGTRAIHAGLVYTFSNAIRSAAPLFVAALGVLWLSNRKGWTRGESIVLFALLLQCAYIVTIGGDVFPAGRFYLLILPVSVLLFWEKAEAEVLLTTGARSLVPVLTVGLIGAAILGTVVYQQEQISTSVQESWLHGRAMPVHDLRTAQLELIPVIQDHIRPEDGSVGLFWLGALGYYLPDYRITDFLGKADPVIAHEPMKWGLVGHSKWDIDFTLKNRNVAVIVDVQVPEEEARQHMLHHDNFAFDSDLALNAYLKEHYTWLSPEKLGVSGPDGLFVRNDLLPRFQAGQPIATN